MRRLSILVADGTPSVEAQFCRWLHGHHTVGVHSGAEAANALSLLHFDLAVIDIAIAEVPGVELVRIVTQQQPWVKILAVLDEFSWHEDESTLATENGADCIALKPMSEGGLRAAVRQTWEKLRAPQNCRPWVDAMPLGSLALSGQDLS